MPMKAKLMINTTMGGLHHRQRQAPAAVRIACNDHYVDSNTQSRTHSPKRTTAASSAHPTSPPAPSSSCRHVQLHTRRLVGVEPQASGVAATMGLRLLRRGAGGARRARGGPARHEHGTGDGSRQGWPTTRHSSPTTVPTAHLLARRPQPRTTHTHNCANYDTCVTSASAAAR